MAKIVVLGAGLGGIIAAYEMKAKMRREDELTIVNLGSTYSFVPSNPWVAVGWRKPEEISVALEPVLSKKGIALKPQGAKRVHPSENRIELNDGSELTYDYLIIATGPDLAFDEVAGLGPSANTQSICQIDHAVQARFAFDALVKKPGPVVIGAVQGASCYGLAYEFAFIVDTALRQKKKRDQVPMTFVTAEPYVGQRPSIPKTAGTPLNAGSIMTNPRGFIAIDKHQRNPAFPNVFGVGVCVAIPPVGKTPLPVGVPKTGFMIESMVTATAENVGALLKGEQPRAVATWNAVCLADFGDEGIAFVAQPQIPPRNVNWSSSGKWVHAAKVGFEKYFLRKIRHGQSETFYENLVLDVLGIKKLKDIHLEPAE